MVVFEVGGDVRATTRAIGPRESTRKARANRRARPVRSHCRQGVVRARSCARSNVERTGGPRAPPVCYAGVLQCFRRCYGAVRRRERCELFFLILITLRLAFQSDWLLIGMSILCDICMLQVAAVPPRGTGQVNVEGTGLG